MNTIMKGTLTKILGYLGQKINQSEKTAGFLASCIYHFYQRINKIKYQFFHFCTLFSHILQIYLNTFLLKIITSIILVWDYKISEQENIIIEPWPLTSFFQTKIIICNSLWLSFMKWITLMVRRSMDIPKIMII